MKIAFFIEHISNGGAERVITNLANSFAKHNHEVIMITTIRRLGEYSLSENVRRFTVEILTSEGWEEFFSARCIGHKRIVPLNREIGGARLKIEQADDTPVIKEMTIYR